MARLKVLTGDTMEKQIRTILAKIATTASFQEIADMWEIWAGER